jgi:hypothetical protein
MAIMTSYGSTDDAPRSYGRFHFDEEDERAVVSDERLICAIHASTAVPIHYYELVERVFGSTDPLFRGMNNMAMVEEGIFSDNEI